MLLQGIRRVLGSEGDTIHGCVREAHGAELGNGRLAGLPFEVAVQTDACLRRCEAGKGYGLGDYSGLVVDGDAG